MQGKLPDYSISLPSKKRSIKPVHPQWAFLFSLKEKQPCDLQSCLGSLCLSLYEAMAFQNVQLNITDLLLAHNLRKKHYRQVKRPAASYPAFAGASWLLLHSNESCPWSAFQRTLHNEGQALAYRRHDSDEAFCGRCLKVSRLADLKPSLDAWPLMW